MNTATWLPERWQHPLRVELSTDHHLHPIQQSDVDLDTVAVMRSQERRWSIFGGVWGCSPAHITVEQDRADLARREPEIERHQSSNYTAAAEISWCVVNGPVGGPLQAPRFIDRNPSRDEWTVLPGLRDAREVPK